MKPVSCNTLNESDRQALKTIQRRIYAMVDKRFSHLMRDDAWQNVKALRDAICDIEGVDDVIMSAGVYHNYLTSASLDKSPYRDYETTVITEFGNLEGYIRCCAAGRVDDPFSAYDIVISLYPTNSNESVKTNLHSVRKIDENKVKNVVAECVKQIVNESAKPKPKPRYVVALDFDGTVVTHEYPRVGKDVGAVPVLKKIIESGGGIVLNTMRSHRKLEDGTDTLQDAINWFKEKGIPLYGINRNPTQKEWTASPKIYGHLYIDDGMANCPLVYGKSRRPYVDWVKMEKWLEKQGYIDFDYSREVDTDELVSDIYNSLEEWTNEAIYSEDKLISQILEKVQEIREMILKEYR